MKNYLLLFFALFTSLSHSQIKEDVSIFDKISKEMKDFKIDTTSVPKDKLSRKIEYLRKIRGGFNINEAIEYKIAEERSKENAPKEELDKMEAFFKSGNGKKWLDNATIWIFRNEFSLREINQLIKFYKSSAGQKMADKLPILMIKSVKASEEITEIYKQQLKK